MTSDPSKPGLPCLTRRRALQLMGGAVAVASTWAWPSFAVALKRFAVGDGEIAVISDGNLVLPAAYIFPDTQETERSTALAAHGLPTDTVLPDCNVVLLRRGSRVVLFDVGSGPNFMPSAGKLLENLAAVDVDPAKITDVVFTHAHPDHLWGLTNEFDELVFPSATYRMSQIEWDYWMDSTTLGKTPEDRKAFVVGAQSRFPLIKDKVELFKAGAEILPGIEAIGTPGHTPGHVSFMLHGAADPVLITGDVVSNVVSFANPDWHWGTDHDAGLGVQTRKRLLDRAANEHARMIGFHLPHPGDGMAKARGAAYQFLPSG